MTSRTEESKKLIRAENADFRRELIKLMIPIAFQSLLETVAHNVDAIMLGFLDANSMSAVSLMANFAQIPSSVMTGVSAATTFLISQYWGAKNIEKCRQISSFVIKLAVGVSCVFTALTLIFSKSIIAFYTDIPALSESCALYLRFVAITFFITPLYRVPYCVMRTTGRVNRSVLYAVIGCISNVILNAVFIFGLFGLPKLGIFGAGLATVISSIIQVILVAVDFKKNPSLKMQLFRGGFIHSPVAREFIEKARIAAVHYVVWTLGNSIITSAFGHMGEDILAANSALLIINGIVLSLRDGLGNGAGILIGNLLGSGQLEKARERGKYMIKSSLFISAVVTTIFVAAGYLIRYLPTDLSAESIKIIDFMLIFYSVNVFFTVMNGVMNNGMLFAGGDAKGIFYIDVFITWCVLVPFALLGTYVFKFPAAVMIVALKSDEYISFPLKYLRYRSGKWVKNLTENSETA